MTAIPAPPPARIRSRARWCWCAVRADRALLKKVTQEAVLPKWAARCSAQCVKDFNATVGKTLGVTASK